MKIKINIKNTCLVMVLFFNSLALAKIEVVTTTTDLGSIVKEVGAEQVSLTVLAKGTQDPHFLEAKPSFMVKMNKADLVIANGLALEVGWLPSLIQGARNPKVTPGSRGYLDVGSKISPIEVPTGKITRADGDVHPEGNPHFTVDPIRVGQAAEIISEKLAELSPENKNLFKERALALKKRLAQKTENWKKRIVKSGRTKLVAHHNSLAYFLNRFDIQLLDLLEPKPGIPPSAQHIMGVINKMKSEKVDLILVQNFFDTSVADRVAKDIPGAQVKTVGIAVESVPGFNSLDDVIENLVKAIEEKK